MMRLLRHRFLVLTERVRSAVLWHRSGNKFGHSKLNFHKHSSGEVLPSRPSVHASSENPMNLRAKVIVAEAVCVLNMCPSIELKFSIFPSLNLRSCAP